MKVVVHKRWWISKELVCKVCAVYVAMILIRDDPRRSLSDFLMTSRAGAMALIKKFGNS